MMLNDRWKGLWDAKYKRVPLHRQLGGWMPGHVRGARMSTMIGNRNRLVERDLPRGHG